MRIFEAVYIFLVVRAVCGKAQSSVIIKRETHPFICIDGTEIPLTNVCDGIPQCPDSSDETIKLCYHIVCPIDKFICSYGACIPRTSRCNGTLDCIDGSDEWFCDEEKDCANNEFRCRKSFECISFQLICDGVEDCTDGSDENSIACTDFVCPESAFQCTYGGCVYKEVVCDGIKDCIDGSDEEEKLCNIINCNGDNCEKYACQKNEFSCASGHQCIPLSNICDGWHQCRDVSDEDTKMCKNFTCAEGQFRCAYGGCVGSSSQCDRRPDCLDWSDEEACEPELLPRGACRLPGARPGLHYAVEGCSRCRPGALVPELTHLRFSCDGPGAGLEGPEEAHCQAGRWLPGLPTCSQDPATGGAITCPPVKAPGATRRCDWPCNESAPIAARLSLHCREHYERVRGASHLTCLHDGTWTQEPLSCRPVCGIIPDAHVALIVRGWAAPSNQSLPWHATLFSRIDGNWEFFCGGTLVAESILLTAGHCVWQVPPDTVKVVLASTSSDFGKQGKAAQVRDVERIELQPYYQDHEGNYNSDLALLVLKEPASINSMVMPACIDWSNSYDLTARIGDIGLIAGMGVTENDTYSAYLRFVSAKVVSEETCRAKQALDFRKYITYTSFCAGWGNGSAVCNGDSGGGFLLQRPNSSIWDIHGIVSLSPRRLSSAVCDPHYYSIFTRVSAYLDWIKQIVQSVPVSEGPIINNLFPDKDVVVLT